MKKTQHIVTCYFCLRKFTASYHYHEFEVCPECRTLQKQNKLIRCNNPAGVGIPCNHEMHPMVTRCMQCGYDRITKRIGSD